MHTNDSFDEVSRLVAGLCFGSDEMMGLDGGITRPVPSPLRVIKSGICGRYQIDATIFISDELFGLGAVTWRVSLPPPHTGYGLLKSYWHDPWRKFTEGQIIQMIRPPGHPNSDLYPLTCVPRFLEEYVRRGSPSIEVPEAQLDDGAQLDDFILQANTRYWRNNIDGLDEKYGAFWQERCHLHLVTQSQGMPRPLWQFTSREELFSTLIDIVRGMLLSEALKE
jgi:hypothetical protein